MNEEIKFALEYLKNITNGDVLAPRHIQNIEEYIEGLIYCINNNNLQSKIDKVIEFIKESNTYYEITHYIPEDEKQFKINMETLTNHLLDILKEDK